MNRSMSDCQRVLQARRAYFFPLCFVGLLCTTGLLFLRISAFTDPLEDVSWMQAASLSSMSAPLRSTKDQVYLLLLIKSAPKNSGRRSNVRNAYASSFSKKNVPQKAPSCTLVEGKMNCFYFVIGLTTNTTTTQILAEESREHGDLVFGDFMDGYTELTTKLIFSLDWAISNLNFRYLLVGDDDTFMNPSRITEWLKSKSPRRLYAGSVTPYTLVIRNPSHPLWGRWYVPESVYAPANYPPYVLGIAYIMSYDVVVESLMAIAMKKQELFGVEDAFYGIIMDIIGVTATQMPKVIHCAVESCIESNPLVVGPLEGDLLLSYSNSYHAGRAICNSSFPTCGWARIEAKKYVKLLKMNGKK